MGSPSPSPRGAAARQVGSNIPPGTVLEQSPPGRALMRQVAGHIHRHGGGALIVDYGYLGEAHHDTLQAVKSHAFHSVLKDPGEADITAHVDFTTLMDIASDAGAQVYGLASQGEFLTRMGADVRAKMLTQHAEPAQRDAIASGLRRLTAKEEMGDLFKVMALTQHAGFEPPGFSE